MVLRAQQPQELFTELERLDGLGLLHVELAWSSHPQWSAQAAALVRCFPRLRLGAASVSSLEALEATVAAGLGYGVSPVLDEALLQAAHACGLPLVPGVFSPSEVHRARQLGCAVVKLFPASSLGIDFWPRLRGPLGRLPACIAAGGLGVEDVQPWLAAGVDAVALGGQLGSPQSWLALAQLVRRLECPAG